MYADVLYYSAVSRGLLKSLNQVFALCAMAHLALPACNTGFHCPTSSIKQIRHVRILSFLEASSPTHSPAPILTHILFQLGITFACAHQRPRNERLNHGEGGGRDPRAKRSRADRIAGSQPLHFFLSIYCNMAHWFQPRPENTQQQIVCLPAASALFLRSFKSLPHIYTIDQMCVMELFSNC